MTITITAGTRHCPSDRQSTYGTQLRLQDPEVHRKVAEYSPILRIKANEPDPKAASADPYPVSKGLLTDPADQGSMVDICGRIQPDPPPFCFIQGQHEKGYKRETSARGGKFKRKRKIYCSSKTKSIASSIQKKPKSKETKRITNVGSGRSFTSMQNFRGSPVWAFELVPSQAMVRAPASAKNPARSRKPPF